MIGARIFTAAIMTAALTVTSGSPAVASPTPPPASTCTYVASAARVPHDPGGVVATAEIATIHAVVTCRVTGALTTAPADYGYTYLGDIGVAFLTGTTVECHQGLWGVRSIGPTLVMAIATSCVFPVNEPRTNVHRPILSWATQTLTGANYTYASVGLSYL